MRQIPTDKYSIAWFKLAECITRGEREKAYGVYRLLAHSLADQAYAYQLEGDLLRCFDDERAFEKYRLAVQAYYQEKRWLEAAGVGEHLRVLNELTIPLKELLIEVHGTLNNNENMVQLLQEIMNGYLLQQQYELILIRLEHLLSLLSAEQAVHRVKNVIFKAIDAHAPTECIKAWMTLILDHAINQSCQTAITGFMSELAVRSPSYYRVAEKILAKPVCPE